MIARLMTIPPRLLHAVRDLATAVLVLTDLGLELLCNCEQDHDGGLAAIGGTR